MRLASPHYHQKEERLSVGVSLFGWIPCSMGSFPPQTWTPPYCMLCQYMCIGAIVLTTYSFGTKLLLVRAAHLDMVLHFFPPTSLHLHVPRLLVLPML